MQEKRRDRVIERDRKRRLRDRETDRERDRERKSIRKFLMNESCYLMSHVTHMNESCHTYECVMSHI